MDKQKILLVAPLPPDETKHREDPPLGLAYIASCLVERGHEVKIWDMGVYEGSILKEIETFQPSIIGIQVMTQHRFFVFNLTKAIKKRFQQIVTVLGGPHTTFTADEVLKRVQSVDIIVRGEGELAMCKIADGEKLSNVHGISFRKNDIIVHNPPQHPLDLNKLPMPAYHLLDLKKYALFLDGEPAIPIFTSRGCPNKCIFCSASHMWKCMRVKKPQKVLEIVKKLKNDFGYNAFILEDDTFGTNYDIARKILKGFKQMDIKIGTKTRVNFLKRDFIKLLKNGGCTRVNFGVESGEPRILKVLKKNIELSQVINAVKNCTEFDIEPNTYFMAGNITETKEEVKKSIKFAKELSRLGANPIWAWGVFIFPGTELEVMARRQNILPSNFSWTNPYYNEKNSILGYSPYTPLVENPNLKIENLLELKNEYGEYVNPLKSLTDGIPNRLKKFKKFRKIYKRSVLIYNNLAGK